MANSTTIPVPISWEPLPYWDGNDGYWNSFPVQVGTPPQHFRVFPSTSGQETWVPLPLFCENAAKEDPGYCGYLRGTLPTDGFNSPGFQNGSSSSWIKVGLFSLNAEEKDLGLDFDSTALYGFDTVGLGNGSDAVSLEHSAVGAIAQPNVWFGAFGIGPKAVNFTTFNNPIPNFMSNLVKSKKIASISWGYTAGAFYRNYSSASMTLGGYDANRVEPSDISYTMNADDSKPLQVGVKKIVGDNTLKGNNIDLLPDATFHLVDSTVPQIWLPGDAVDRFVENFGLEYDNATDFYLLNDTIHEKLKELNPTITFVLSDSITDDDAPTQEIKLPYGAFDLQASYPYYQPARNYFPIRRADNNTQHTIGRTFLQEAYITADFSRNNFSIGQAKFDKLQDKHIIPITEATSSADPSSSSSSSNNSNNSQKSSSSSLSSGAIAGIVVGAIVALALLAGLILFLLRRKKKNQNCAPSTPIHEKDAAGGDTIDYKFAPSPQTAGSGSVMPDAGTPHEVSSATERHEMGESWPLVEAEGSHGNMKGGSQGAHEIYSPYPDGGGYLAEAPANEARTFGDDFAKRGPPVKR